MLIKGPPDGDLVASGIDGKGLQVVDQPADRDRRGDSEPDIGSRRL
jgi:hypothetical protein